jgi:uncharacterized protein (DUF1697 family)
MRGTPTVVSRGAEPGTFVVLLRGVNVGKGRRVPMAAFKALLTDLGCSQVATLLNSGNAVVRHPDTPPAALAAAVQAALKQHLGLDVPVIVKSAADLQAIVDSRPLVVAEPADPSRFLVALAATPQDLAALEGLSDRVGPAETFVRGEHAAYLHCPGGLLDSQAGKALLGTIGRGVTTRNWATVLKLYALACAVAV